jgi:pyrimidine-nucleoside phosphorylase/thymidine phosphorylase
MVAMRAQEIIRAKRDGQEIEAAALEALVAGIVSGEVPDYQAAAFLMAVYFRGLSPAELAAWTGAMLHSGEVLDLSSVPGVKVDKHSTGGVGDKLSLCLAPAVAACGVPVPMISGRGLGHTGGTLDKLEAIPGFRVDLAAERFLEVVRRAGLCLIGQTERLVPADRKLYALRDVTATVESIPLIASSIMSKKLAEGIDGLVLDVKVGGGAFMKTRARAEELARTLIGIGERAGKRVVAVLTSMEQPIGYEVGNASEVREAVAVMRGGGPADLVELTRALGAEMLLLGGRVADVAAGRAAIAEALRSGAALARFREMVALQGGDPAVAAPAETAMAAERDGDVLPRAPRRLVLPAAGDGFVVGIDAEAVGIAAMELGAGRRRKEDTIDAAAGITLHRKIGERVARGEPLATLWFGEAAAVEAARMRLGQAFELGDAAPDEVPLILGVIRSGDGPFEEPDAGPPGKGDPR